MGFVGDVLEKVNGLEWFYIVGILIFIVLFGVIVYRTLKIPKPELEKYKNAILDKEDSVSENNVYHSE